MDPLPYSSWLGFFFAHRQVLRTHEPGPRPSPNGGDDWSARHAQAMAWETWWDVLRQEPSADSLDKLEACRDVILSTGAASSVLHTTWAQENSCDWLDPLALAWVAFNDGSLVLPEWGPGLLALSDRSANDQPVAIWRTQTLEQPLYLQTFAAMGFLTNHTFEDMAGGWKTNPQGTLIEVRRPMLEANPWFTQATRLWEQQAGADQAVAALMASFNGFSDTGRLNALVMLPHLHDVGACPTAEIVDTFETQCMATPKAGRDEGVAWATPFRALCRGRELEQRFPSTAPRSSGPRF